MPFPYLSVGNLALLIDLYGNFTDKEAFFFIFVENVFVQFVVYLLVSILHFLLLLLWNIVFFSMPVLCIQEIY